MEKIAVIGMACRYPGANNIEEFWENLLKGKETIKHFSDEDLRDFEINYDELKKDPKYVPARGILEGIDKFDAGFFGVSPNEAANTDPQHRVWLETVWDAFENAGCDPFSYPGAIGVYAGGYINTYLLNNILRDPVKLENFIRLRTAESFQIMTGNDIAYLPTKTAYKFNLRGPAINVQTACSTSLVAVSQACQSLFTYESDICIAGGVCIVSPQESGYIYQEGAIPSPDGHCRPFDANANGTVFSNGVGVVILKRLEDALKDNDTIYAVVNGWALNNDGNKKVSYTAPSVDGQAEVILMAQGFNDVSAEEIGYIEAHGTATNLGDPIEIAALTKAFSRSTSKKQFCGIGSVKSNIGHTDAAAGIASFIKVCLSSYHRIIPPSLHYKTPNPQIDFENTPFYVVDKLKKWDSDNKLVMGVSSFGIGGTNSHVLVEEPPRSNKENSIPSKNYIIPLSARTATALETRKIQLRDFVKKNPDVRLDELAFTLWKGRNHMKHRASAVVRSSKELLSENLKFERKISDETISSLAFMFPGQGAQYYRMGSELYKTNKAFQLLVDEGFSILKNETGIDLKEILFDSEDKEISEKKLAETSLTQPAIFIIEYSLAKILIDSRINPKYLIGHSIGEYVAACVAGVFDYPTALRIVIKRGELMQGMKPGKMVAALCNKEKLREIGSSIYEIAAENAPNICTISFETNNLEKVKNILDSNEISWIPLNTSHAFHSEAFNPILDEFSTFVNNFILESPGIPVISCLTGKFLSDEQAKSGEYWAKQLRNTVMFYSGITTILENEPVFFVEVGPNTHLSSNLRVIPEFENKKALALTLGKPDNLGDQLVIERVVGNIWAGLDNFVPEIDFNENHVKKILLPTYPFERERHWVEHHTTNPLVDKTIEYAADKNQKIEIESDHPELMSSIMEIWKAYLGMKEIKPGDDFFNIGGSSLLAISVSERINKKYNINFSLREFLNNPTLINTVDYIEKMIPSSHKTKKQVINAENRIISGEI